MSPFCQTIRDLFRCKRYIYVSSHLLGTGRQQFVENGGVEILKRFCFNVAGEKVDKRWDRLLCRSCVILSRCCPSASLPVLSDGCPIKFDISREHSFLPEGTKLYHGPDNQ